MDLCTDKNTVNQLFRYYASVIKQDNSFVDVSDIASGKFSRITDVRNNNNYFFVEGFKIASKTIAEWLLAWKYLFGRSLSLDDIAKQLEANDKINVKYVKIDPRFDPLSLCVASVPEAPEITGQTTIDSSSTAVPGKSKEMIGPST